MGARIGFGLLALLVAAAGLTIGLSLRERPVLPVAPPGSALVVGEAFPDVVLAAEDGSSHSTVEILREVGGVVLFLDLECPPCSDMSLRWQSLVDEPLRDMLVFGIASAPIDAIRDYKESLGLSFPIYSDAAREFQLRYDVDAYPLRVVVSRSNRIQFHTYDPGEETDLGQLAALIDR